MTVNKVDDERLKVAAWNGDRPSSCLFGSNFDEAQLCPRNGRLVAGTPYMQESFGAGKVEISIELSSLRVVGILECYLFPKIQ